METKFLKEEINELERVLGQGNLSPRGRQVLAEYKSIIEFIDKQLLIQRVSNQRELLIAYSKKIDENLAEPTDIKIIEKFVDEFISNL